MTLHPDPALQLEVFGIDVPWPWNDPDRAFFDPDQPRDRLGRWRDVPGGEMTTGPAGEEMWTGWKNLTPGDRVRSTAGPTGTVKSVRSAKTGHRAGSVGVTVRWDNGAEGRVSDPARILRPERDLDHMVANPTVWRIPREEFVGPWPHDEITRAQERGDDETASRIFAREREKANLWDAEIRRALSLGDVTPDEAHDLGYRSSGHDMSGLGFGKHSLTWQALPPGPLFHVTTARTTVEKEGLKTRHELAMSRGRGLGGGEDDTISLTTDEATARSIANGMRELRRAIRGEFTVAEMVEQAKSGTGAVKPWWEGNMAIGGQVSGWGTVEQLDALMRGRKFVRVGTAWTPDEINAEGNYYKAETKWEPVPGTEQGTAGAYNAFERDLTPDEVIEQTVSFYKSWSYWREQGGKGPEDPLFIFNDPTYLRDLPEDEIAALAFTANPGAQGYPLGAMKEWRIAAGEAVRLVGSRDFYDPDQLRIPAGHPGAGRWTDSLIGAFACIVGSENMSPRDRYHATARAAKIVERHGGHAQRIPNGVAAHFPTVKDALEASRQIKQVTGGKLRVGISEGSAENVENEWIGRSMTEAARIAYDGIPGDIMVAADALPPEEDYDSTYAVNLKGLGQRRVARVEAGEWTPADEETHRRRGGLYRHVSFSDLADFSGRAEVAPERETGEIVGGFKREVHDVFTRHGGRLANISTGDGAVAVFDDADAAVAAAEELVQVEERLGFRFRTGIATGQEGGDVDTLSREHIDTLLLAEKADDIQREADVGSYSIDSTTWTFLPAELRSLYRDDDGDGIYQRVGPDLPDVEDVIELAELPDGFVTVVVTSIAPDYPEPEEAP